MKLKLATYNIRLGIQQGLDAIADVLRDADADFVALQEVGRDWIMGPPGDTTAILADLLGYEFSAFVPAIDQDGGQYGTAVLSRYDLGQPEIISLYQDVDEPRKVARFEIDVSAEMLTFFTTHLSWIEDRAFQIAELCDLIGQTKTPVFLLGDLNEAADVLQDAGLFEIVGDAETLGRLTFPADDPESRIDYICASHGQFHRVEVHRNHIASDHLMVFGEWEWSDQ